MRTTRPFLLAAACALAACQSATAIVVDVSTDVPCGNTGHLATTIAVGELANIDQRPPAASATRCDPATGHIGTLVVVPSGADNAEVAIRVVTAIDRDPESCAQSPGTPTQGCIVARRGLRFIPHETIELPIEMSSSCEAIACADAQTCVEGACVSATVVDPGLCAVPGGCADAGDSPASSSQDAATDAGAPQPAPMPPMPQPPPPMPQPPPPMPQPPPPMPPKHDHDGGKGQGDDNGGGKGGGDQGDLVFRSLEP